MTKVIGKNNPVKARLIIEALSSKTRLEIIGLLLRKKGLTASEISQSIGISLSTIMEHLDLLCSSEILKWTLDRKGGRLVKRYFVSDRELVIKLDLYNFSVYSDIRVLRDYIDRFIGIKTDKDGFPLKPSVRDIRDVLGVDTETAIAVIDLIRIDEEYIVNRLADKIYLKKGESLSIKDMSAQLNVHEYWALRIAQKLSEKKDYVFRDNVLFHI